MMKPIQLTYTLALLTSPLALFASSDTDRKIEETTKSSYNYRTVLEDHVQVKVTNGVATLSGTVRDEDEKVLAADTVLNVPGVVSVKNEIAVKSTYPEHSDAWMAFKIRSRLLVKANVSMADTKVAVENGVVTLTGTADNVAQKELTGVYAKEIDWVKSVKNEIMVRDNVPNKPTLGETIDDASITSQVKFALLNHKGTRSLTTHVITKDGVVSISGEALTNAEKSLVTKLAEDVRGVKSVSNEMTVRI